MTQTMTTQDATVLVVDDDPEVRRGVSRLLRSVGIAVRTFASPQRFFRERLPAGPACVLLDLCMEGMTGLEVQEALGRNGRGVPVIFLSGHATVPAAATGFRHGARDFLEKPFRPEELLAAVRQAIEEDRRQGVDRHQSELFQHRYERLTPREQEVMALVVSGQLNKQAAVELGISEKTIKVHRARVMEKMEVESLAALVLIAERLGVASTPESGPDDWAEPAGPCLSHRW
ncbi:MAG TPA: response regulator [Tepidisphaeraceae bacterium]|nr:response regulator [Tepidisphaeraceae bacterium]